eukprot:3187105-Amphidinium_carterae.1
MAESKLYNAKASRGMRVLLLQQVWLRWVLMPLLTHVVGCLLWMERHRQMTDHANDSSEVIRVSQRKF